jgi:histidine triad (HIT) family protein
MNSSCIFCEIVRGKIPANIVYESTNVLAFEDINPLTDFHYLIIPKLHIQNILDVNLESINVLGEVLYASKKLAETLGLKDGFRNIINNGIIANQEVYHLHIHFISSEVRLPPMFVKKL